MQNFGSTIGRPGIVPWLEGHIPWGLYLVGGIKQFGTMKDRALDFEHVRCWSSSYKPGKIMRKILLETGYRNEW